MRADRHEKGGGFICRRLPWRVTSGNINPSILNLLALFFLLCFRQLPKTETLDFKWPYETFDFSVFLLQ